MDYKLFQEHRETKYGIHLVEETSLDTLVYSIVHLNDTGKVDCSNCNESKRQ